MTWVAPILFIAANLFIAYLGVSSLRFFFSAQKSPRPVVET
jgi:hypothetical protein